MIRAVLNCLLCGSKNRHNHCVFQLCTCMSASSFNSVCVAVRIQIGIRAAPYCILCESGDFVMRPVVFKISVLGVIFFIFDVSCLFQAVRFKKLRMGRC